VRYAEIRLSGSGGQGLGLAGKILSEAAIAEDFNVCQTQSYGPEARGGSSKTDVIVSKDEILFPNCRELDVLLAMNQESCTLYAPEVRESGVLIIDSTFVDQIPVGNVYKFPFTSTAQEEFKTAVVANMIAMGLMSSVVDLFKAETWRRTVTKKSPERFREMNLAAFELGCKAGLALSKEQVTKKPVAFDRKAPVPECLRKKTHK
jgi:2-oxoglutarate ferredoxin oxidoreductase subunit gamma